MDAQTKQLVKPLENLYAKAPALPVGAREFIVSIAPWVALILGILSVVGFALSLLGWGTLATLAPYAAGMHVGFTGLLLVASVLGLVSGVLYLLAYQPLKKRALKGWNLLFWVLLINAVSAVVSGAAVYFSLFSIVWALIWFAVELYFLLQVKAYYK
jgi:hypothetical protein